MSPQISVRLWNLKMVGPKKQELTLRPQELTKDCFNSSQGAIEFHLS